MPGERNTGHKGTEPLCAFGYEVTGTQANDSDYWKLRLEKDVWGQTENPVCCVVGLVFFQLWGVMEKVQSGNSTEFGG